LDFLAIMIQCQPSSELVLVPVEAGPSPRRATAVLKLANTSDAARIAFKVKSTRADAMAVTPKEGFLARGQKVELTVALKLDDDYKIRRAK